MERGVVIRGHLRGRVIELDEPVDDVEEGEVEVQIRSVQSATPRPPDLLDVIATRTEPRLTSISSWPMSVPAGPAVADVYLEGQPGWRSAVDEPDAGVARLLGMPTGSQARAALKELRDIL